MSPSKGFVALSLGFIFGIAASYAGFNWGIFAGIILASLILLIFSRSRIVLFASFLMLGVTVGFLRAPLGDVPFVQIPNVASYAQVGLIRAVENVSGGISTEMFNAMVLGDTHLSIDAQRVLNVTGTRHIVSISGLHMTIVALLIFKLFIFLGLWRRQAFYCAVASIALYVLLVGAPAPAIRAGIVASLYLAATHIQRLVQPWRLLLAAGLGMLFISPNLVTSVSFQLSFAAMCGILFLHPYIRKKLSFISVTSVRDLMSVSLSAQLTTWPIVAYVFQSFSAVGVIANLIIVPVLPIVMMFGIGFILLGWVHPFLSSLFVWPAWVVLKGSYAVLEYLASIPYVAVSTSLVNVWVMIIYYIALVSIFFMLGAQKLINEPAS